MGRYLSAFMFAALLLVSGLAVSAHGAGQPGQSSPGPMIRTESAFPTGERSTSVVLLERWMPRTVRLGQPFEYKIKITNLTSARISDVVLTEQYPVELRVASSDPRPDEMEAGRLVWRWEALGPRAAKVLTVRGSSDTLEKISCCARVTFATFACGDTQVVEPVLELVKAAPAEVLLCDPIPLTFTVRNAGTGVARRVRIIDTLPEGWTTADGERSLLIDAGDLASGQSRDFRVTVRASGTGRFTNLAQAMEEGGLSAESAATTVVRQPVLVLSKRGPEYRFVGRPVVFQITVANEGDAPATDVVVTDPVPAGMQFVAATQDGRVLDERVVWNVGTLAPGTSAAVEVTFKSRALGKVENTAVARAECAEARGSTLIDIRGIPAILLEVVDVSDPIEVGSNETYEITVVNQGSADGTNIQIVCTLPPEQEYVSATGPTPARVEGQRVAFDPLARLAPQATATYRVVVKGLAEADARFKVSMTSDQIERPVEETESTHVY